MRVPITWSEDDFRNFTKARKEDDEPKSTRSCLDKHRDDSDHGERVPRKKTLDELDGNYE